MGYRVVSSPTVSRNGKQFATSLSSCWKAWILEVEYMCCCSPAVGEIAYSLFECASCKDRSILDNLYLPDELVVCPMIMASAMEMVILENIKKRQDMVIVVDSHRHEMVA